MPRKAPSDLELRFIVQLQQAGSGDFTRNAIHWHPVRPTLELDFAWPAERVGIELQGGTWKRGSDGRPGWHLDPARYTRDVEKLNDAMAIGWAMCWATGNMVDDGRALVWTLWNLGRLKRAADFLAERPGGLFTRDELDVADLRAVPLLAHGVRPPAAYAEVRRELDRLSTKRSAQKGKR